MLRQAVFLCLLLAGMAVAQVDNIQIFVLTGVASSIPPYKVDWKWRIGSERCLPRFCKFESLAVIQILWVLIKHYAIKKLVASNLYAEIISLCSRRFFQENNLFSSLPFPLITYRDSLPDRTVLAQLCLIFHDRLNKDCIMQAIN